MKGPSGVDGGYCRLVGDVDVAVFPVLVSRIIFGMAVIDLDQAPPSRHRSGWISFRLPLVILSTVAAGYLPVTNATDMDLRRLCMSQANSTKESATPVQAFLVDPHTGKNVAQHRC